MILKPNSCQLVSERKVSLRRHLSMVAARLRLALVMVPLTVICASCAPTAPTRPPLARQLPAPPAYAQPVTVRAPKVGDPLLLIAARERAGRTQANARIVAFRKWYMDLQKSYARGSK